MTYEGKSSGGSFASNIKHEMMEFRARIDALEAMVRNMGTSGGSGGTAETGATGESEGTTETNWKGIFRSEGGPVSQAQGSAGDTAQEIGKATDNIKSYTDSVVDATYLIREASIAMRGYGMMLDQMGISKDQKKMVHEMEETMMMIHKMIQTIHLLEAANTAFEAGQGPLGILEIGLAGGVFAGSMAYGNKVIAGAGT